MTGKRIKYILDQEDVDRVAEIASQKAVSAYVSERKKWEKEHDKRRMTKKLLASYRRIKRKLRDEKNFTDDEKIEFRWRFMEDLMGSPNISTGVVEKEAQSRENQRRKDLYDIFRIEQAIDLYRDECEKVGGDDDKRRYRELTKAYIVEDVSTMEEIAISENVSTRTLYNDLEKACKIVAIYLFGADAG